MSAVYVCTFFEESPVLPAGISYFLSIPLKDVKSCPALCNGVYYVCSFAKSVPKGL